LETVSLDGKEIAYDRHGIGIPLVLLHGYPLDHTIWEPLIPLLLDSADLILPDLRGCGQSTLPDGIYSMTDMASDIAGLLDRLQIDKAVIAGHSMGGYVALAFARAFPDRVLGLGLVSTQALDDSPEKKEGRFKSATEILENGVQQVAESMPAKLSPNPDVKNAARSIIAAQQVPGLAGALQAMAGRQDSSPILGSMKYPVAILHGTADELIPIERAREMKASISQAELTEIEGGGHMLMLESPAQTAEALKRLL
jgi:3-oxoadipate enol-lactonase